MCSFYRKMFSYGWPLHISSDDYYALLQYPNCSITSIKKLISWKRKCSPWESCLFSTASRLVFQAHCGAQFWFQRSIFRWLHPMKPSITRRPSTRSTAFGCVRPLTGANLVVWTERLVSSQTWWFTLTINLLMIKRDFPVIRRRHWTSPQGRKWKTCPRIVSILIWDQNRNTS